MKEIKCGGGHYICSKCGETVFGSVVHYCTKKNVMNNIHDIEEAMPHKVSEVICVSCRSRWIAIRPERTLLKNLECKNCGQGYVIETGEVIES